MDTQILAGAGIIALLLLTTVGATQTNIDDPVTRQIPVENNPLADNKPEITNLHPPDGAENLSANPEVSFRVQDVDTETLDVVVLTDQQSEVIYNEEVESGNFVEIPANNTTLGDDYNKDYSWTVEVSDETNRVQENLEFSTMNPFTSSPDHQIGDATALLDYSGNGLEYSSDCPEWNNMTSCIESNGGNPKKIGYDNPLYLQESNEFNIQFKIESYYETGPDFDKSWRGNNAKIIFYDNNGSSVQFKQGTPTFNPKNMNWTVKFVQQPQEDNYAVSFNRDGGTEVKTVNFDKYSEIFWRVEEGEWGYHYRETSDLKLYSWDTDMATLKDDVDESFLSILMSVF